MQQPHRHEDGRPYYFPDVVSEGRYTINRGFARGTEVEVKFTQWGTWTVGISQRMTTCEAADLLTEWEAEPIS